MNWFSIETSSPDVSMAVGTAGTISRELRSEGNASILAEPLCRKLDPDWEKIDHCVIGQGPGSYNGLRVGYAFLKGLLLTHPLPVFEVPTPLTLAAKACRALGLKDGIIFVLNNARREEVFGALIEVSKGKPRLQQQKICSEALLREIVPPQLTAVVSYDYLPGALASFSSHRWLHLRPDAATAAEVAFLLELPPTSRLSDLQPHYVREAVPGAHTPKVQE